VVIEVTNHDRDDDSRYSVTVQLTVQLVGGGEVSLRREHTGARRI
jgi:hypothetical protein